MAVWPWIYAPLPGQALHSQLGLSRRIGCGCLRTDRTEVGCGRLRTDFGRTVLAAGVSALTQTLDCTLLHTRCG